MNQGDIDPQVAEIMRASSLDAAKSFAPRIMDIWSKGVLWQTLPVLRFEKWAYQLDRGWTKND